MNVSDNETLIRFYGRLIVLLIVAIGFVAVRHPPPAPTAKENPKCLRECQRGCEPPEVCSALLKDRFQ